MISKPSFKPIKSFPFLIVYGCFFLIAISQTYALRETVPNEPGPWPGIFVNTYTGNLFYQRSDLFIPGQGLSLDITFYYNSGRSRYDWGYGHGWTHTYSMRYFIKSELSGDTVILERMDGKTDEYVWNGTSYDPPVGVHDVFSEYEPDKYLLRSKSGIKYYFDDAGHKQLTKIQDPNGNTMTLSYTDGHLATITDPTGRQLVLDWSDNHLSTITDANTTPDRIFEFSYDQSAGYWFLTGVEGPLNYSYTYTYGMSGNMTIITDSRGNSLEITYNPEGAVASVSCPAVNMGKTFTYNPTESKTTVYQDVTAGERNYIYTFDDLKRIVSIQQPDGNSINFSWDDQNNILTYTNETGAVTTFTYDDRGNILSAMDCLGFSELFTYENDFNQITSITDRNGNTTTFTYDDSGNRIGRTDCLGYTESYTYDAFGNMTGLTDNNGCTTLYGYNGHGYRISTTDALGFNEIRTFDEVGNALSITDKNGCTTTHVFDILDRMTARTDAAGNTTTYTFNENGSLLNVTNPKGCATSYTYDAANRIITTIDPMGGTTTKLWDEAGNLISVTDAN
ncbi:MAG: DUF6531 domain-containing protein, partial [Bacteroidales bacterium]|nr:DUF6531 domain-containing protein [Bacteroidales bacterium]